MFFSPASSKWQHYWRAKGKRETAYFQSMPSAHLQTFSLRPFLAVPVKEVLAKQKCCRPDGFSYTFFYNIHFFFFKMFSV